MGIPSQIQAVLFFKAEPLSFKELASLLKIDEEGIHEHLSILEGSLKETGLQIIRHDDKVTLGTASGMSDLIENIKKEELSKTLTKSALETLSIVLYKCPVTRAEIDHIRGVNSNFSLRTLTIRGLVEKADSINMTHTFQYKPTIELLAHLGVAKVSDLPDYQKKKDDLERTRFQPRDKVELQENV